MDIDSLLREARAIWDDQRLTLDEIIVRLNVIVGDISRISRDSQEELKPLNEPELKKEMGNIIFSMIRWCDDLGCEPKDCIALARQAQIRYNTERNARPQ